MYIGNHQLAAEKAPTEQIITGVWYSEGSSTMDVVRLFRNTREWITPVLQESAFTERGVLTPEEFVRAGDQLILKCPTWSWQSGEKSKIRPYLPADKQFLIIRGCPSHQRVTTMNAATVQDYSIASALSGIVDKDGDWCAPQIIPSSDGDDEVLVDAADFNGGNEKDAAAISETLAGIKLESSIPTANGESESPALSGSAESSSPEILIAGEDNRNNIERKIDKADEYEDMEDESLALDESATTSNFKSDGSKLNQDASSVSPSNTGSALLRSRRYDVSITYDKYYQVNYRDKFLHGSACLCLECFFHQFIDCVD